MTQTTDGFVTVARVGEILEGGVRVVRLEDQAIAVFLIDGAYYALDDVCTHDGGPLGEGTLDGYEIACPRHGARFDIRNGCAKSMPATEDTVVHDVRVTGDNVFVKINDV